MMANITFSSFLLFSMCHSIHVAVNTWINCSFFTLIFIMIHFSGQLFCIRVCVCVFHWVWCSGNIPDDWRKGIILPLYKGKGSRHDCSNCRGITRLSVPGKTFARILLSRIKDKLHQKRRIQQSGFTPGRSTMDRIATLSVLHQTRREFSRPLWVAYVDLKAAFDSVDRNAL